MNPAQHLPLPRPGGEGDEAFPQLLAAGLSELHRVAGGKASDAAAIGQAASLVATAILAGEVRVDLSVARDGLDAGAIARALQGSPVVCDGQGTVTRPLVLAGNQLYLARYWDYQQRFEGVLHALNRPVSGVDPDALRAGLDRHFKPSRDGTDWQKVAAATAILRQLCVISGGPGTGKTSTVVKILAILLTLDPALRIAIAAPTGKAAARVQESIRAQLEALDLPAAVADAVPRESHTVHRLLGYQPGKVSFRRHRGNPLPYDVVVVDEASMLDLALAAKLTDALRPGSRLILLGDKDQLSSVEAGAVYAGISSTRALGAPWAASLSKLTGTALQACGDEKAPLADSVVWLEHSYRFATDSALGRLARAINAGAPDEVVAILRSGDPAVLWETALPGPEALAERLVAGYAPFVEAVLAKRPAPEVFAAFDRYRVLAATRAARYGSARLGRLMLDALRAKLGCPQTEEWFVGRPVLVTANDYTLRLFNGDVGIVLPDADGRPMVHFQGAAGSLRAVSPMRLGNVDDALAITVHRAQGSEFGRVALVIDPDATRGLSRPLVYTGVTRARDGVALYCDPAALAAGLASVAE